MGKAKKKAKAPAKKVAAKKTAAKKTAKVKAQAKTKAPMAKPKTAAKTLVPLEKIAWNQFLTPLDDRLIVQVSVGEKTTAGGLFIPETSVLKGQTRGTVLAIGRGHLSKKGRVRPMDVQKGDVVLFEEYAGSKTSLKGVDVRILRESEILGIVEK